VPGRTRPLEASRDLFISVTAKPQIGESLTFECIATIKVDSSLTVDRKVWCTFRRRKRILGWYLEVDHNYVRRLDIG